MIQSSLFFCLIFIILKHTFIFYCKIKKIKISKWLLVSTFDFQNGAPARIIKKGNATNTHHMATILLWTTSSLVLPIFRSNVKYSKIDSTDIPDWFFFPPILFQLAAAVRWIGPHGLKPQWSGVPWLHTSKQEKKQQTHLKPRAANSWRVFLCQNSLICNQKTLHSM